MKVCMFHLMPYRDLPADFVSRYNSAFIDPLWFDVADSDKVGEYYNATLDELLYAAKAGFHGVCTNQHHQNVYGFMANPSLMGAVLAKETNGQNIAIVQLGSTLPSTTPPTRIAEEYAMLDCISGGRLVAGFPTGLPSDAVISNGIVPIEQRERFREALALVLKAWSATRDFRLERQALSARHGQSLAAADPAAASAGVDSGLRLFLHRRICRRARPLLLSPELFRRQERQGGDRPLLGPRGAQKGRDDNPYRLSFLQLIGVAETDAEAEDLYAAHAEYFFHKLLYSPQHYLAIPGCLEYGGLVQTLKSNPRAAVNPLELKAKDFYDRGYVVVGSPKTVREQLLDGIKELRMGHLLALLHFGSMPTALCKRNIDLFAREVLPYLRRSVGRQIRRPLVARASEEEARRRPRHGRRILNARRVGMATVETRRLKLWQGRIETEVEIAGKSGPPLVYLHGPWGLGARPRLRRAARRAKHRLCAEISRHQPRRYRSGARPRQLARPRRLLRRAVRRAQALGARARRPLLRRPARRRNRRRQPTVGRPPGADRSSRPVA